MSDMSHEEVEKVRWDIIEMVRQLTPKQLQNYYWFRGFGALYCGACGRQFLNDELYCLACERRRGPYFHLFYDLNNERLTPMPTDWHRGFYDIRMEGIIFEVSKEHGALVVYTKPDKQGQTLRLSPGDNYREDTAFANVVLKEYEAEVFMGVAIFPHLPPGTYTVEMHATMSPNTLITIFPGHVAEVDWR